LVTEAGMKKREISRLNRRAFKRWRFRRLTSSSLRRSERDISDGSRGRVLSSLSDLKWKKKRRKHICKGERGGKRKTHVVRDHASKASNLIDLSRSRSNVLSAPSRSDTVPGMELRSSSRRRRALLGSSSNRV
jgi:hypothetical protein